LAEQGGGSDEPMTEMKRKLIEYDLPLVEISEESAREKSIRHGHPSTLHIWWARRPLAVSRATTFAALIDDPEDEDERQEMLELIKAITPWDAVKDGNSPSIQRARELIENQFPDDPPKVLDPFAGGGSIPLEALRLGCETYASDYNPVAVFIEKATLEWPQKYGIEVELNREDTQERDLDLFGHDGQKANLLAYMVEKWAKVVLEQVREEIERYYPRERGRGTVGKGNPKYSDGWIPVGYVWARTVRCQNPSCGAEIPLIRQFWLSRKKDKRIAYWPVVKENERTIDFTLLSGRSLNESGFDPSEGTVSRGNASCPVCGQVTKANRVRKLARAGKMGERLVAVVLHHPDETGKRYRLATVEDERAFREATKHLQQRYDGQSDLESPLPQADIPLMSGTFNVPIYGITKWKDLFNARQQLALLTFVDTIRRNEEAIRQDANQAAISYSSDIDGEELANVIVAYLGLILDKSADYSSVLTRWAPHGEYVGNTLTRQALPMSWDYFELSLISGSGGDWLSQLQWVLRYILANPSENRSVTSHAVQASATSLPFEDSTLDAVLTDPPYYNSVPYADLSDFFYVWLKRSIGHLFPSLFSTPLTPKTEEAVEMAHWDPERYAHKDRQFFENMLRDSFREMYRTLKSGGIAVIVYAHKSTDGWEAMLNALVGAGFVVTASWPVHTEMRTRLRAAQSAALASSIYMVCRKAKRDEVGFWSDIKPRIRDRVYGKMEQFWGEGIVGGDFFISAIGPGMEVFSQYERVEDYTGQQISTLELLQFIRGLCSEFLVKQLLGDETTQMIEPESRFYLTYRWTFMDNAVPFDDARKIAAAQGVDLTEMWDPGGFVKKSGSNIRVLGPTARGKIELNSMVDAKHRACQLWRAGKKNQVQSLLSSTGYGKRPSFWVFCQAVAESLDNGNKEKQLLEGLLMGREEYQTAPQETAAASDQLEFDLDRERKES